jgi:hypothetical protein
MGLVGNPWFVPSMGASGVILLIGGIFSAWNRKGGLREFVAALRNRVPQSPMSDQRTGLYSTSQPDYARATSFGNAPGQGSSPASHASAGGRANAPGTVNASDVTLHRGP